MSQSQGATADPPPSDYEGNCNPNSHVPKNPKWRELPIYMLFEAAYAGCLECVKYWVEVKKVSPLGKSGNMGYTALDWATLGEIHARDAKNMVQSGLCQETALFLKASAQTAHLHPPAGSPDAGGNGSASSSDKPGVATLPVSTHAGLAFKAIISSISLPCPPSLGPTGGAEASLLEHSADAQTCQPVVVPMAASDAELAAPSSNARCVVAPSLQGASQSPGFTQPSDVQEAPGATTETPP